MSAYVPRKDSQFALWLAHVRTVVAANPAAVGLTPAQVAELESAADAFSAAYATSEAAKGLLAGLIGEKDEERMNSESVARELCQMILANPAVSTAVKGQLGLSISPRPFPVVSSPEGLCANAFANGTVLVKWNRAGAPFSTTFTLEARVGTSKTWVLVAATSKSRVTLTGYKPGEQVLFRVQASRGGKTSPPSNVAVIYPGSFAAPVRHVAA